MKLLVVDDHPIFVAACKALFEIDDEIAVIGAHSAETTRSAIRTSRPDVMIIDANLSGGSGLELVRELIAEDPALRIIVVSVVDEPRIVRQALDHGAKGFVSKRAETEELIRAVLTVAWGEIWLPEPLKTEDIMSTRGSRPRRPGSRLN